MMGSKIFIKMRCIFLIVLFSIGMTLVGCGNSSEESASEKQKNLPVEKGYTISKSFFGKEKNIWYLVDPDDSEITKDSCILAGYVFDDGDVTVYSFNFGLSAWNGRCDEYYITLKDIAKKSDDEIINMLEANGDYYPQKAAVNLSIPAESSEYENEADNVDDSEEESSEDYGYYEGDENSEETMPEEIIETKTEDNLYENDNQFINLTMFQERQSIFGTEYEVIQCENSSISSSGRSYENAFITKAKPEKLLFDKTGNIETIDNKAFEKGFDEGKAISLYDWFKSKGTKVLFKAKRKDKGEYDEDEHLIPMGVDRVQMGDMYFIKGNKAIGFSEGEKNCSLKKVAKMEPEELMEMMRKWLKEENEKNEKEMMFFTPGEESATPYALKIETDSTGESTVKESILVEQENAFSGSMDDIQEWFSIDEETEGLYPHKIGDKYLVSIGDRFTISDEPLRIVMDDPADAESKKIEVE